jgi:hypothetical protein
VDGVRYLTVDQVITETAADASNAALSLARRRRDLDS